MKLQKQQNEAQTKTFSLRTSPYGLKTAEGKSRVAFLMRRRTPSDDNRWFAEQGFYSLCDNYNRDCFVHHSKETAVHVSTYGGVRGQKMKVG